jgi:membrane protease YdiL (CAAX protease family)
MRDKWRIPILCIAAGIFLVGFHFADLDPLLELILPSTQNPFSPARGLYQLLFNGCAALLMLGVAPAILGCILWNERPSNWGLSAGRNPLKKTAFTLLLLAALAPAVVYAASVPSLAAGHPGSLLAAKYPKALLLYEAGILAALLGWEFFFRGFLLFGLHKPLGNAAIYVLIMPSVIVGAQHSPIEALTAIPIAVFLGHLAIWTGSIWYGFLLHWMTLLAFDLLVIYRPF